MTETSVIDWQRDPAGIVVLTIDDPDHRANIINTAFQQSLAAAVDRLETERDEIAGVVLTSAKKTFVAGGDLAKLQRMDDPAQAMADITSFKNVLRRLEKLGKPVVAALNGSALGGGLEIALACHHRIAADIPGSRIGLPEVTLGLLPGAGGLTRVVRMLGVQNAVLEVGRGKLHRPAEAKEIGIVDELVDSVAEVVPAAKAWIGAHPDTGEQPWDQKGYRIPGGTPANPSFAANLPAFPATLRKQIKGANFPAPRAILSAAVEGSQVDFDNALLIESRYFVNLLTGQVAKNMIQAFYFDKKAIDDGGSRPSDIPSREITRIGVLGAGMMGAGIAYVSARAGFEVILKDVSLEAARRGKEYSEKLETKALERGRTTEKKSAELLARITPTADTSDLAGVDFVIEAVFENTELKQQVFGEIQDVVAPDAVLGSNTSTLPITRLATGVKRPGDFIGIHFFSPVDKMPLVEIITGGKTTPETLARAYDYVLAIHKTPIVVSDSRGFFTSRVIGTFVNEAIGMLAENIEPAVVEQAGLQAGYPAPPLQLSDELNLTLLQKIRAENLAAAEAEEKAIPADPAAHVVDTLVAAGRTGKLGGAGFYEYAEGKRVRLWPGLREKFQTTPDSPVPFRDLMDRMLFIEAIETQKCFDEGVLHTSADANIGSIFGIGYPAWTGGVHQFVIGYPGGRTGFVARADELAAKYGQRFAVPDSLRR